MANDPNRSALLIVDVQNDFCPGGALAVAEGDRVIPVINAVAARFAGAGAPVFASRDWHPATSRHFAPNGGTWPAHCVAGTPGAAFHPGLALPPAAIVISKGDAPEQDGYSAFEGHTDAGEPFADALRARGVTRLVVAGLATDYCVKQSVLSAREHGLEVVVLSDGIRAVDLAAGDGARAVDEMTAAGAVFSPASRVSPHQNRDAD